MKILIAEDDRVTRQVLKASLISLGHEILEVEDGAAAVEALAQPGAPSLAILDWLMPRMDGLEVVRALRQRPGRYVYVVLLTARDGDDDMIEALDAGADDFLTKPFKIGELRARLRAGDRVLALQDDLLRSQDVLRHEAAHDRLTGLWNRGRVLDELARELRRSVRELSTLAVVMADVDHFKQINDTHGHAVGDAVLKGIAERIAATLRASDSVGRYGGEEFLFVLPQAGLDGARDVADRVRAAIASRPIITSPVTLNVTLSLGVSCSSPSSSEETLIQAADQALYRAKANGRNRVEVD
ncbi:MAG: diguanylate cyclase [Cyanobacteria bacterium]|nr:diguanylate cyclase [Cyanobacteriota bacterium]